MEQQLSTVKIQLQTARDHTRLCRPGTAENLRTGRPFLPSFSAGFADGGANEAERILPEKKRYDFGFNLALFDWYDTYAVARVLCPGCKNIKHRRFQLIPWIIKIALSFRAKKCRPPIPYG